ncbi:uncharacterized protein SPPG_06398 [Spizellomyces punctatus DAOM BR117]|uniref:C2H2-type domain-containing protein n=1 Tax=Spizellomyces punctatus (strain DAOM BR117) TaxID=645134 RepID=A0A0L0HAW3_SPIPD|nr:uncharacterized protein SPPG_06398 [Spizellomyces punctatus DAOM BR117]KNC98720.1 hypothetical protein SPPG_06398 [Spizellomyces punctatus DAOM BR117]|eukprot:XP_016606760.1 hypothetical protein SPPG_06398 [Spizellomyces punctatus DAOM BR117]
MSLEQDFVWPCTDDISTLEKYPFGISAEHAVSTNIPTLIASDSSNVQTIDSFYTAVGESLSATSEIMWDTPDLLHTKSGSTDVDTALEAQVMALLWGEQDIVQQSPHGVFAPSAESIMEPFDVLAAYPVGDDAFLAALGNAEAPTPDEVRMPAVGDEYFGGEWAEDDNGLKALLTFDEGVAGQPLSSALPADFNTSTFDGQSCTSLSDIGTPCLELTPCTSLSDIGTPSLELTPSMTWSNFGQDVLSVPMLSPQTRRGSDASTYSYDSDISSTSISSLDSFFENESLNTFVVNDSKPTPHRAAKRSQKPTKAKKIHTCPLPNCNRTFTRKFNLTSHIQAAHSGLRPFVCPHCKTTFARKHDLRRHIASLHTAGPHPFRCPGAGCTMTFARSDALKRHLFVEAKRWREGASETEGHWELFADDTIACNGL